MSPVLSTTPRKVIIYHHEYLLDSLVFDLVPVTAELLVEFDGVFFFKLREHVQSFSY